MGLAFELPFSSYWDASFLEKELPLIDFFEWKLDRKPSYSLVVIDTKKRNEEAFKVEKHCLSSLEALPFVDERQYKFIELATTTYQEVVEILSQETAELLLLCWISPDRVVKETFKNVSIPFSESATSLGRELSQGLGRYIAIHVNKTSSLLIARSGDLKFTFLG